MIYYLNKQQFKQVWDMIGNTNGDFPTGTAPRIRAWNTLVKPIHKLTYTENEFNTNSPDYYGSIEGEEKHINIFILKEL